MVDARVRAPPPPLTPCTTVATGRVAVARGASLGACRAVWVAPQDVACASSSRLDFSPRHRKRQRWLPGWILSLAGDIYGAKCPPRCPEPRGSVLCRGSPLGMDKCRRFGSTLPLATSVVKEKLRLLSQRPSSRALVFWISLGGQKRRRKELLPPWEVPGGLEMV